VITSPFTFVATAEAIAQLGAVPVFADIDPATFNIDPEQVEAAISPQTKAIVPVHLFGRPAPVGRLRGLAQARGIAVVEDAAQAFGARAGGLRVGTIGDAGAFSFFPTKPLGGFGDGGLVTTADAGVAAKVRRLRAHGAARKHHSEEIGRNSRLDELQAAMLRVRLVQVDPQADLRRAAAHRYGEALADVAGVTTPTVEPGVVVSVYTVRISDGRRPEVAAALGAAGIASAVLYPIPLHRLPPYARAGILCPEADRAAAEVLSLPMWANIPLASVDEVAGTIAGALRR
jgi:dTDP-4-amino-4,6-dideoxygalactose transaminase